MPQTRYRFGEFELDPASRELWRNGVRVALPPKSFECLAYLIAHRDRAVGRDELISAVWGRVEASDTLVAQTLLRARKALDDSGDRQAMVRTVPRFGYRWVAAVQEVADIAPVASVDAASPLSPPDVPSPDMPSPDLAASPATAPGARRAPASPASAAPHARPTAKPARRARRWVIATALLAIACVGGAVIYRAAWRSPSTQTQTVDALAMVLPVQVSPTDAENSWVRLGAMDYISSRVRRSGLKVLPSDQTLHLSSQINDAAPATASAWQQLESASGAHWILAPQASRDANGWRVRLQWQEGAREQMVEAHGNTPLAAAAIATDNWLHRQGRHTQDGTPTPLTERLQQIDAELTAGQLAAVRRLLDEAPQAQQAEPALQVRQAQLAYRSGRIDEAEQQFLHLLRADGGATDVAVRARALMGLGAVGIRRRNFVDAQTRYTQALELLQRMPEGPDDPGMLGNAYNGRGVARVEQQQMEGAVQDLGMARIAMQRAGDLVEAAMVGTNLGMIEDRRGHYAQALQEFDRAIATYERFGVHDYLAAALSAKAETQITLAQAGAALATITRASAEADALEDPTLAVRVGTVQARAQIENGRLNDAEATLRRLRDLGMPVEADMYAELSLRLALAQGRNNQAAAQARQMIARGTLSGATLLLATEAAVRASDKATLQQLRDQLGAAGDQDDAVETHIANALLDVQQGHRDQALATLAQASAQAGREGNPDRQVRAGVAQVQLLLDAGQPQAAAALLGGDLAGYAASDYRVAWAMVALYRALGDGAQLEPARIQAEALRGERRLDVAPVL